MKMTGVTSLRMLGPAGRDHRRPSSARPPPSPSPRQRRRTRAPTSRSSSPAEPTTRPASAGPARLSPMRSGAGRRPHPDHIRCQLSRKLRLPGRRRRGRRRHQPHLGDGGFLPVDPDRPRRLFTGRGGGRHAGRHTAARQQNRRGRIGAAAAGQPGTQRRRGGGVRKPRNEVRESGDIVGLRR